MLNLPPGVKHLQELSDRKHRALQDVITAARAALAVLRERDCNWTANHLQEPLDRMDSLQREIEAYVCTHREAVLGELAGLAADLSVHGGEKETVN